MKKFLFITLIASIILYTPTERTTDDLSCGQHEPLRKDCGWSGISQKQCESKGCCYYQSSISGVPWCFKGIDDVPTYLTLKTGLSCALDRNLRKDCGYKGIEKAECESKDCCYKIDDYESEVPWCFYGVQDPKTVTIEEKVSYDGTEE